MKDKSQEHNYQINRSDLKKTKGLKGYFSRLHERRVGRKFAAKSGKVLKSGLKGVGQEAVETKEMTQSFFRLLASKLDLQNRKEPPTKEEVKAAIEQLKDVGRFSIFATISILPGGGVSLIGLEILARKLGVKNFTFVPSAFKKKNLPEKHDGEKVNPS